MMARLAHVSSGPVGRTGGTKVQKEATRNEKRPFNLVAVIMTGSVAIVSTATGVPPAIGEANGVGLTPAMGWSSWSFLRQRPDRSRYRSPGQGPCHQRLGQAWLPICQRRRLLVRLPGQPRPGR